MKKLANYSKPELRSRLNFFYALMHGTGITAAVLGLGGLAMLKDSKYLLILTIGSFVWLVVSVTCQFRYKAYRTELERRCNESNNPNP